LIQDLLFLNPTPFLKWAGGKTSLRSELSYNKPLSYNKYIEPFLGGGSVLFIFHPERAVINDVNSELINAYKMVKHEVDPLVSALKEHQANNNEEYYYKIRNLDRDVSIYDNLSSVDKAARMIYLNKTGFNGLYRVNSKGQFNVPIGGSVDPDIVNEANLLCVSAFLNENDILILNGGFEGVLDYVEENDFVYLDPPYDIIKKQSFVTYNKDGFNREDQKKLKEFCDVLTDRKCKLMLSNSYTEFILDLYKDYNIKVIEAQRFIGASSESRGKVKEVLVLNF